MLAALPIDAYLSRIVAAVDEARAVVVVAAPGAGKTTRVPPALLTAGPLILLQPRRVAARSLARRIAEEQGWILGEDVGWQVRHERRFSARTRLLVATEGILTARLQADPLLEGFQTVVLDEFHERSLHADLALALVRQAARARSELRIVVMSATLDATAVARFLGGCPVVEVPGRLHPVEISHAVVRDLPSAVREIVARDGGHVLAFLPGAGEIRRAQSSLADLAGRVRVLPLHGSLTPEEQDEALRPSSLRKVLLATNVAETSLTVDGVTDVVDGGQHKVVRYDVEKGLDRLDTERVSQDSADQRAGRAGRTGPGRALRLWSSSERLRPHREPEIARVDLAGPVLEVLAWGGDPRTFEWFEAPPPEALDVALQLLERLGALERGRLTPLGQALHELPLHPRLARVLLAAGATDDAARACALLSERIAFRPATDATDCDVLTLLSRDALPFSARETARSLAREARPSAHAAPREADADAQLRRALFLGFPDRVARRREPGSPKLLLASGTGASLGPESGVRDGEWVVCLDISANDRGEPRVRVASRVEREWLEPTRVEIEHRLERDTVRAYARDFYEALPLGERPILPDPAEAERRLLSAARERGFGEEGTAVLRRLAFAGLAADVDALLAEALRGRTDLPHLDLAALLPHAVRRGLDRLAPEMLTVPSGRSTALQYRDDGSVVASVKLQELFGLGESPRLGPKREPVLLELLAPNGRPVQTTRDLRGFWDRTYPEVRKELRGRYPRHPWPEDPWTAPPTARAKRRG